MDVDCEKKAAGVGEKGSVIKRRKRCERKRERERGTVLGVVLLPHLFLDPSGASCTFFVVVCLFEVVPMTVPAYSVP